MTTNASDLKTTNEVSKITGQAPRTIQIHAAKYGIGKIYGGVRLFDDQDVETLKSHKAAKAS
jgi:DNA-binding transcriptional MerR regulator